MENNLTGIFDRSTKNRLVELLRGNQSVNQQLMTHPGTGVIPTQQEIKDAVYVGLNPIAKDIYYGEKHLQGPTIDNAGLLSLDPTDYLSGAQLAKASALLKAGAVGLGTLGTGMGVMHKLGARSVPSMFGQSGSLSGDINKLSKLLTQPGNAQPKTIGFNDIVKSTIDEIPVDKYAHDMALKEAIDDIDKSWANSGHHDVAGSYYDIMNKVPKTSKYWDAENEVFTDEGYKYLESIAEPAKHQAALDIVGPPKKKEFNLSRPQDATTILKKYLEANGIQTSAVGGSGKSGSKYLTVIHPKGNMDIRVSDHALPGEYGDVENGLDLFNIGSDVGSYGRIESLPIDENEALDRIKQFADSIISKYKP